MSTTSVPNVVSLSHACVLLQRMPGKVRAAIEALGIEPELTINEIPHYAESDVEKVGEYLREQSTGETK